MKGKPLLPTLRTKKRYVVYQVISGKDVSNNRIVHAIFDSFKECFGIFCFQKAGLKDMKIYNKTNGILKINHKYVDELRTALCMVNNIDNIQVILHTVGVSGVINKAKARV